MTQTTPRMLFATYMAGGNATILQNLQEPISARRDVRSAWLPIELDAESARLDRRPRRPIIPGTIRNSMVTGGGIRALERDGGPFDGAYFFPQTICMLLFRFRRRVPHVIAMDGTPLWYAREGLWYAQLRFDPKTLAARAKHAMTRRVYEQAFHLLPLSCGVRDSLVEEYGIPAERITVVPPGVNLSKYAAPIRRAPDRAGRPLNVLFVGADYLRKGGDLVVTLGAQPAFRDVQFHIVTKSFRGPAVSDNVHVHTDLRTNTEPMVKLFREADVFVLPTRQDSHSVATLEAMAMGLPVISTAVGGIVDLVEEGETGYLIPREDVAALADRVARLRDDPELAVRMGLSARSRVESRFDGDKIAAAVVDLLKRAAASRS